jgi:hypothetical protein
MTLFANSKPSLLKRHPRTAERISKVIAKSGEAPDGYLILGGQEQVQRGNHLVSGRDLRLGADLGEEAIEAPKSSESDAVSPSARREV